MASSLLCGDNNLHQAVNETFYACNRVTETFGDDHTDITGGPRVFAQNGVEARPMPLDLQQDNLVSFMPQKSIFLRSSASSNSHERSVNVPTFSAAARSFQLQD
ncbi:unnamed protein product [Heligmosomoides polygyrus]|uniref:Uncharacterized protein n=1 Tax=Heligmosomoides polygyrus TaxID=6339 RepID=A0A183FJR3_HELPZ|nr:unnamed protein product [Heligmosomoides polygyrus]